MVPLIDYLSRHALYKSQAELFLTFCNQIHVLENTENLENEAAAAVFLNLERAMGIEPTSEAWEASILPLYDARLRAILPCLSRLQQLFPCKAVVLASKGLNYRQPPPSAL
jgi:hypothetical protein